MSEKRVYEVLYVEDLLKRIAELEAAFNHCHVKARNGRESPNDTCLECGLDLRNPIHRAALGEDDE